MLKQKSATTEAITLRPQPRRLPQGVPPPAMSVPRTQSVRIVVAEREWFVREALASVFSRAFDLDMVGQADTAERALELVRHLPPEVVIVDPHLPEMGGLELARRLRDEYPETAIMALTDSQSESDVVEALRAGISGYVVTCESNPLRICETVRLVASGATLLTAKVAGDIVTRLARSASSDPADDYALTSREREVLAVIGNGLSNRQIAGLLFITERSVKNHVRNVFVKLGVNNRTSAALLARSCGLAGKS
jgi:DNA-binding NarL/FixJ family response regulator